MRRERQLVAEADIEQDIRKRDRYIDSVGGSAFVRRRQQDNTGALESPWGLRQVASGKTDLMAALFQAQGDGAQSHQMPQPHPQFPGQQEMRHTPLLSR